MGSSAIKNPRRIFSQNGGGEIDPSIETRLETLENNEYQIIYWAPISSASGSITKPTNSTIILDQFQNGADAFVSTIVNGQPSGIFPQTAGGVNVDVSSFNALGAYTLSGTPSAFDVALIYIIRIKAKDYSNIDPFYEIKKYDIVINEPSTQIVVGTGTGVDSYSGLTYDNSTSVLKLGTQASKGASYFVQFLPYTGAQPVVFGDGSGYTALWMATATPSSANYLLRYNGATAAIRAASNLSLFAGSSLSMDVNAQYLDFTPQSNAPGLASIFNFRPPATTGHTASTEQITMYVNMSTNALQRATGAVATQRDVVIAARTHSFVAASTITNAGTLVVTGAPIAGTNATITNAYSIWSQAGKVRFQGLPTSAAGLQAGDIWNNAGVLNIV